MFTVASLFTKNDGDPATGLTLTDIDVYLYRRAKATGAVSTVWNGENPTEEIGGGLYGKAYTNDDLSTYEYFAYAQYTGATTLDTNYALQNAPTNMPVTTGEVADAVWDEASAGHTTGGSFGETLHGNVVQSGDAYLRIGSPAGASVSADVASIKSDTAAILVDTGTSGVILADDAITSAKFDESTAYPIKSADTGATQIARVGADGDTLETLSDQLDTVTTDTNELQTDWTDGGRLDLLIDAILADTTNLNDTTLAEITGILDVPSTPTIRQAIMLLYMAVRNNSQSTATERRILNDAGTEVLDATMSDDGTTFSQGKLTAA